MLPTNTLCCLGTVFAYGQTGTGKTYTMEGVSTSIEQRGVIPNSFAHIFNHINSSENEVDRSVNCNSRYVIGQFYWSKLPLDQSVWVGADIQAGEN